MSTNDSHPALSYTDDLARSLTDVVLLAARILVAAVFILFAMNGSPTAGYVGSLGVPNPGLWSLVAIGWEFIFSLCLILGIGTRYGSLMGIIYVVIATAVAHRYWEYPQPQQLFQYTNFTKNLAILGGLTLIFLNGGGKFSVDRMLSKRQRD